MIVLFATTVLADTFFTLISWPVRSNALGVVSLYCGLVENGEVQEMPVEMGLGEERRLGRVKKTKKTNARDPAYET